MRYMVENLNNIDNVNEAQLMRCYNKEREINNMRNQLRSVNVSNINEGKYTYQAGIYYMDVISDLERTGDYIINVADAIKDMFRRQ